MNPMMTRPSFTRFLGVLATMAGVAAPSVVQAQTSGMGAHKVSFQVSENDPAIMNLALNNIANLASYYSGAGAMYTIELVAYGPGLQMLLADTSPVKDRLVSIKESIPEVTFSACNVTLTALIKKEGHPIAIVPQARLVPAGVVRLMELQELRYAYIKP